MRNKQYQCAQGFFYVVLLQNHIIFYSLYNCNKPPQIQIVSVKTSEFFKTGYQELIQNENEYENGELEYDD